MACTPCGKRDWRSGRALLAAAVLSSGVFLASCSSKEALVKAARAEVQPITRSVSTNGKVELTQNFEAHAVGSGQVKQIFVSVGQTVKPGQLLLRLDDTDAQLRIQTAKASIASAQHSVDTLTAGGNAEELLAFKADATGAQFSLDQARTRLSNLQQLQSKGAASASEVNAAQNQVTEAQNRLNAIQARRTGRFSQGDISLQRDQVNRSRAELAAAQSDLANNDIHAPFAGTVYALPVAAFANVSPGEDLINVADLNKIRIRAFFDEPEIGRLSVGQPVRIVWDARPDYSWHGHISQTPTSVTNYGTRNVGECLITVDDAHGDLLPNVNVTVYVQTLHRDSVLAIPRESLRTDGTSNFVYKIVNGKLERANVQVDVVTQTLVQITGGLQPGDQIVQVPMNDVEPRPGIPVKVQP